MLITMNYMINATSTTAGYNIEESQNSQHPLPHNMLIFVRMSGTLPRHRKRFLCTFWRSLLSFWNPQYTNKVLLLLDDEEPDDHVFGDGIQQQFSGSFPQYNLQVKYEKLPSDPLLLPKKTGQRGGGKWSAGYNRQLYSSFLTDMHVNNVDDDDKDAGDDDTLIVFMDNDAMYFNVVVKSNIVDAMGRPRVMGSDCAYKFEWIAKWNRTTYYALGMPMVSNFMSYFPVYIYASTIRNCRQYLLKRWNTTNFEVAFERLSPRGHFLSPICILLSYAYYYERERYDWNLEICRDGGSPSQFNQMLDWNAIDSIHHIQQSDMVPQNLLPTPQTAFHKPYASNFIQDVIPHATFCFATSKLVDLQQQQRKTHYNKDSSKSSSASSSHLLALPAHCPKYTYSVVYDVLFTSNIETMALNTTNALGQIVSVQPLPKCAGKQEQLDCNHRLDNHFTEYANEVVYHSRQPINFTYMEADSAVEYIAKTYWDIDKCGK